MTNVSEEQIINSALWAAYGDALGFITELADTKIIKSRTGIVTIKGLIDWKRQIGGQFGTTINLPKGSYSDDTQLRLATSRAIMGNGHFSIHSFSKIELPVWQSYALGAGRGSKVAAGSLAKNNIAWYNNFYETDKVSYLNSGGNGAAMRIQPHVWSAVQLDDPDIFLPDVIKNSLTTHGHPRAIAGSVFHALCLSYTLFYRRLPSIEEFKTFNQWTLEIPRIISQDNNLNTIWMSHYESVSPITLIESYYLVFNELGELISLVEDWYAGATRNYKDLAQVLDLYKSETRGSGTLTALAASAACLLSEEMQIDEIIKVIVNELWTDTDSIATMAGAILGAKTDTKPLEKVQDEAYIIKEAKRLYLISIGEEANSFEYSNHMTWKCPVSQLDFLGMYNNKLVFFPFGIVESVANEEYIARSKTYNYEWLKSDVGQSFLIKKRASEDIKKVSKKLLNEQVEKISSTDTSNSTHSHISNFQSELSLKQELSEYSLSIDALTSESIKEGLNPVTIGRHIIQISESEMGTNGVIAYSAIISKALIVRRNKR
ncbi:ADP-ribosylglycohydrolase family protein [Shewanella sp. H8]|uniref:ADP-ribosylglycohydrolase family protein n=1 Tax=Shewanella sp. H8 TaxID=3342676 RepID=UPI003315BBDD